MSDVYDSKLYGLILAAGQAARFGSAKQLASLGGTSLLARAAALGKQIIGARCLVVTGAHVDKLLPALSELGSAFTHNPHWQHGPGSSIRAGVRALPCDCQGVLIWHADQALLDQQELCTLRDRWLEAPDHIVAARYAGGVGAPTIFPRRVFDQLSMLKPQSGAKRLIMQDRLTLQIDIESAEFDIDTPADLARAEAELALKRARDSRSARS